MFSRLQVGIDSTASTAAFLVHHLAANPEKQEKLFEEICNVIGPTGKVDEKALGKMRFDPIVLISRSN